MSDERPDEFFSWRSRLGPPDALPEQGLDNRDLTWEKLAHRLGKAPLQDCDSHQSGSHASARSAFVRLRPTRFHPPRRRLTAYRIAAACLLLLLIPAARLFHNHLTITPQPSNTIASPQPGAMTAPPPAQRLPLTPVAAEASPVLQSGPTPKELARLQTVNNKNRSAKAVALNRSLQNQAATPNQSATPNQAATRNQAAYPYQFATPYQSAKPGDILPSPANTPVTQDSPVLISGLTRSPDPTPPQNTLKNKQLRIVHVNELDNPPNPAPAMTSIRSREPDIRVQILLKNH